MKKFNYKSKKGFTLIELLVVIGILAVLAAIAIPSVAGLIDRANVSADDTNANEMTNAIERFTSEYELYCQDIASNKVNFDDLDSAQGRIYNSLGIKNKNNIEKLESGTTFNGYRIDKTTKYPQNWDTATSVITNYIKTSSVTFLPKQTDKHFYYSPDCGIIIWEEQSEECNVTDIELIVKLNKQIISGKDAKGNALSETTRWVNLSVEGHEEIENNPYMHGIGKTKPEYVVAVFNEDYSSVTIRKNGINSDGLMKDFSTTPPFDTTLSQHRDTIKEIIVEEGVISIGKNAFSGFDEVTKLELPDGFKIVDFCAFNGCDKLAQLKFPETMEYFGDYAFYTCRAVTEIDIPASVNHIGNAAFGDLRNCPEITVSEDNPYYNSVNGVVYNENFTILVQYPAGKTDTSYELFNTTKLIMAYGFAGNFFIESVTLPEGLEEISWYAFSNTGLKSISFPSTIKKIDNYAFRYSKSLKSTVTIPKGLTNIGTSAFSTIATEFIVEDGNPNYKAVDGVLFSKDETTLLAYPAANTNLTYTVPTGVTKIGEGAFLWSQYVQEITLSNTVTTIDTEAFNNFVYRQKFVVTIPENVVNINKFAFKESYYATIRGKTGSTAETFAKENNITFIAQ